MEHCVTALRLIREQEIFREYIGDGLYSISQSVGKAWGGQVLQTKYTDLRKKKEQEPETTEAEVIESVTRKLKAMG